MTLALPPSEYEERCQECNGVAPLETIHLDFDGKFRCRPCSLGGEFSNIAQANRSLAKYVDRSRRPVSTPIFKGQNPASQ